MRTDPRAANIKRASLFWCYTFDFFASRRGFEEIRSISFLKFLPFLYFMDGKPATNGLLEQIQYYVRYVSKNMYRQNQSSGVHKQEAGRYVV